MSGTSPVEHQTLRTGGCLCGAIRYELEGSLSTILLCHCRNCQRASGAAASANTVVASRQLRITQGEPRSFSHRADSGATLQRYFCGACGSPIFSRREQAPEFTVLKISTLDIPVTGPVVNLWTESAPAWLPSAASAPSHPRGRSSS